MTGEWVPAPGWQIRPGAPSLYVTSPFGVRIHPVTGEQKPHRGMDIRAEKGTPILCPIGTPQEPAIIRISGGEDRAEGIVVSAVIGPTTISYYHCLGGLVPDGTKASSGTPIALSGDTGRLPDGSPSITGPHVHMVVKTKVNGELVAVDPLRFISKSLNVFVRKG